MNTAADFKFKIADLPSKPGIYIYHNFKKQIIYVGKAKNIKNRVSSYFNKKPETFKLAKLVSEIDQIDYLVTDNEVEALIAEYNFIKEYHPKYNVEYRDDKSYPCLSISINDEYPRLHLTREKHRKGRRYFGPYAQVMAAKEALDTLLTIFPIRTCSDHLFARAKLTSSPCLYYHINRCVAPCVGKASPKLYNRLVTEIIAFLEGRQEQVIANLKLEMEKAARQLEFEKAAYYRDRLKAAKQILEKQKVSSDNLASQDALGLSVGKDVSCVQLLKIRNGKLIASQSYILNYGEDISCQELLASFVKQNYLTGADLPKELILPLKIDDIAIIEKLLAKQRNWQVKITVPRRGKKRELVKMAEENAKLSFRHYLNHASRERQKRDKALEEIKLALGLKHRPNLIEGVDVSTISGTSAVASIVSFKEGLASKQNYRRYKLTSRKYPNDFAMMKEVIKRRLSHLGDAQHQQAKLPDLVLVDGGKPQLKAALEAAFELGINDLTVAALAKKEEIIFIPGKKAGLSLAGNSAGLQLLQQIRDEAHRFALNYHQHRRRTAMLKTTIDQIPGVGRKRRQALLKAFGSLKQLRAASQTEIAAVPGISNKLAKVISDWLRKLS
jgi:excinuclease ABC subunit C